MSDATSERVRGHALEWEGAAMVWWDDGEGGGHWRGYHGAAGAARCTCGGRSPDLPSDGARKRWHRRHKADVLARSAP